MKLINGRGQLGEELKKRNIKSDWIIYHTWNFLDKSFKTQKREYSKFTKFVDKNKLKKIAFISTKSIANNYYVEYKRAAEFYLIDNVSNCKVICLPNLLGKGICQKLKAGTVKPHGVIEIMTIRDACNFIEVSLESEGVSCIVHSAKIPAKLLYEIFQFGKK